MRLLYCGDVVGRSGRAVVLERLPALRERLALDAVIVNGENAAGGFGVTSKICREFFEAGCDVVTTGNHVWDQRELIGTIDAEPRVVRPANMHPGTPGRGVVAVDLPRGRRLVVAQVMCRLFMGGAYDDPFRAVDHLLAPHVLGGAADAVVVDLHGEATSEKMALGHYLDGRATLVAGTHTHVPTADLQILPGGTAYVTDVGMCGDYDSVIGMSKEGAVRRFTTSLPGPRLEPAGGAATLCAVFVETDDRTGRALRVEPVRQGGRLAPTLPAL